MQHGGSGDDLGHATIRLEQRPKKPVTMLPDASSASTIKKMPQGRQSMITRRHVLASAIAAPAILRFGPAQAAQTLKISHQFPGGTIDKGDFRDRLTRKFAEEVTKRS